VKTSNYISLGGVELSLEVGGDALPAFEWLLANWKRVLERCWEPFRPELDDNGYDDWKKQPRGLRILPKIEHYLRNSQNSDYRTFAVHIQLPPGDCTQEFFETVLLTQFAIYDAVDHLKAKRPKPDVLSGHFEKLKGRLPPMPFRFSQRQ
jgi:hypothetical protein